MARRISRIAALAAVLSFGVTSAVGAYDVPGKKAGSPGGPPTKPKGAGPAPTSATGKDDRRAAVRAAHALALAMAGFTNEELASHGPFHMDVDLPSGGKLSCSVLDLNADEEFGGSSKTYDRGGTHAFEYELDVRAEEVLKDVKGIPIKLLVSCRFKAKDAASYQAGDDNLRTDG